MGNQSTIEWLDFPINVFIDTQVFIQESYDFSRKGKFAFLKKHIDSGKVKLLSSNIVKGEVERHIKSDVSVPINKILSALDDRRFAILRESQFYEVFQSLAKADMVNEAVKIFNTYLADSQVIILNIETVKLQDIISDYFEGLPPFGEGHKKSEFPDAFNVSMIQHYAGENGKVYIVSGDGDFASIENVMRYKTLNELLDAINSQDEICSDSKQYILLDVTQQSIYDRVESDLMDIGFEIKVDGTDTDRKGISSGYEYEEIELLSVLPKKMADVEVIDIDYEEQLITISLICKTELEFSCSFFDEENSIWDSEDKEYPSPYYGTMHEVHNASIPVVVNISFDDDKKTFYIENVEVDTDIELNQYTLKKNGRERTDDPYSYWDDAVEVKNPCPDCCCEITFENDGGNGFCINCAPNH